MDGKVPQGQPAIKGSWVQAGALECVTKRATYPLCVATDVATYTHSDCVCNEVCALRGRHQVADLPDPIDQDLIPLNTTLSQHVIHLTRRTRSQVIQHYPSNRRAVLVRAAASLVHQPIESKDGYIKMFLKDDKYQSTSAFKAPRCIQYRNKRYCLELARYLQPIEHHCYGIKDEYDTFIIAKGRNSYQRASDILAKAHSFHDPVYLCLDHSNFDAHVSRPLLKLEHSFYEKFFPGDTYLPYLLSLQLNNKGFTKNGTRYFTPGTRMSGDMNTGLGNSVINYAMLQQWLNDANVPGSIYVDGDDSVIVISRLHLQTMLQAFGGPQSYFTRFGMRTKSEIAYSYQEAEFCQSRPVCILGSWRMCRNPTRVADRTGWTTRKWPARFIKRYIYSLGLCELSVGSGVPIHQSVALSLIRRAGQQKYWSRIEEHYIASRERYSGTRAAPRSIDYQSRLSFEAAWGITPQEQIRIEAKFNSCKQDNHNGIIRSYLDLL